MNFSNAPSDQWNWEPKHAECYWTDDRDSWFYGLRIHKNDFNLKFEIFFDILFWTLLQIGYEWKLIALLLKKKWEPFFTLTKP